MPISITITYMDSVNNIATVIDGVQINQIINVLIHVTLSASLTTLLWTRLYGAKSDLCDLYSYMFFDPEHHHSTGNVFFDALFNAVVILLLVILMTFMVVKLVLKRLKRTVIFFMKSSQLMLNLILPIFIFNDLFDALGLQGGFATVAFTFLIATYFSLAFLTFYTDHLPGQFHRSFTVINCSLVAVLYLRILPRHTVWLVLTGIILWDLFSVRYEGGPFRNILSHANEYGEHMLRFLTFSAANDTETECSEKESQAEEVGTAEHAENDDVSHHDSTVTAENGDTTHQNSCDIDDQQPKQTIEGGGTRSALDALRSGGTRLGMGDFVFFGLLVAKACSDGSPMSAVAAMIGVNVGLAISLIISFVLEEIGSYFYLPALPLSLVLGMLFHFVATFFSTISNGEEA